MKIIQFHEGPLGPYGPCVNQVRKNVPAGVKYEFITDFEGADQNCDDYRAKSNIVRAILAIQNPDMLWLDTDIIILKWLKIEFEPGKVYFARGMTGFPENYAFFVNGRTDFFAKMYNEFRVNGSKDIFWFGRFVKKNMGEIRYFPTGIFDHIMISRAITAGNGFHSIHAQNFNLYRRKETGELISEVLI